MSEAIKAEPFTQRIDIRVEPRIHLAVQILADKENRSVASMARVLLLEALKRRGSK